MGQQQLLLVILVTIIVGIATVVAINIFGSAADQANRDAVRQDLMGAAVQAQAIWSRPILMAGADRNFENLLVAEIAERLNIPGNTVGAVTTNENGVYTVASRTETAVTINSAPASGGTFNMVVEWEVVGTCGAWRVTLDDSEASGTVTTGGCAPAPAN
jgi:Tfp pilus assembly protein PilE